MKKLITVLCVIPIILLGSITASADETEDAKVRILKDEVIYQILIDRFNNGRQAPSNQVDIDDPLAYSGGDIQGITNRLDKIKENGFTAISVSPVMENAKGGYHGYWVEDFFEVEEEFGTMEDLKTLVEEAHDREIKVLLELDLNYIAKSSEVAKDSEKSEWFKENTVEPIDATKWLNKVVVFDQTNKEAAAYLTDVADYWMDQIAIDGYTLHAADQMDTAFLEKLAKDIKAKDDNFYLLATTLQGGSDIGDLYTIDELDAVTNAELYEKMNRILEKPDQPVSEIYETHQAYEDGKSGLYLDNITTPRFSNNFADNGRVADTAWNIALGYLYFTPGVPIVYQGSEVPMYGPGFPENQYLVDFASADPDLESTFYKMASIRKQYPALSRGDFEQVAKEGGMSLFKRTYGDETVYVAVNNDSKSHAVEIEGEALNENVELRGMLHDDTIRQNKDGKFLIGMERESSEVFIIKPNLGFNWGFIGFVVGLLAFFVVGVNILAHKQKKRNKNKK